MPNCQPYSKRRSPAELTVMRSFIGQVKAAMREQGMTQSRLAEITGFDPAGISLTLRGGHSPKIDRMVAIAAALGMDVEVRLAPPRK